MMKRPQPRLVTAIFVYVYYFHLADVVVHAEMGPPPWKSFLSRFRPRNLADRFHSSSRFPSPTLRAARRSSSTAAAAAAEEEPRGRGVFLEHHETPSQQRPVSAVSPSSTADTNHAEWRDHYAASPKRQQPSRRRLQQLWKVIWERLPPSFHDRQQWGRLLASSAQIGLIVYLVHAVWKAANEVLDEYYYGDEHQQSGMEPAVFDRDRVLLALEQVQRVQNNASTQQPHAMASWRDDDRTMAAVAIAQRLAVVGLPLRGGGGGGPGNHNQQPSVESILSTLSRNEANLLQECLWLPPRNESPPRMWERIFGLERVKRGLMSALSTVQRQSAPHAYASLFDNSSAGVLLYGPPGCGKTMIAMALSAMSRIPCLLITPSVLLRKYVGETNQQCRTLFSLASKLSPCIMCIDELDGLFRKRNENEHEVSRDLKTEFLQHWEGMSSRPLRNLVIAATNRPFDVDEAVLRRFTQSHLVGLPDITTRTRLLRRLLQDIPTAPDIDPHQLAAQTEAYSPSDLRRLLQTAAAMGPLRESISQPRPLTWDDIQQAIHTVPSTPLSAEYRHALTTFIRSNQGSVNPALPNHPSEDGYGDKWETEWGNFYHLGSLQVDAPTFELLSSIMERLNDMANEWSDWDEDDENHYHDED